MSGASLFEQPDSPTDLPSYEYSVARPEKTSLRRREIVDEDGWLIYDAGAFEQAANEASSSAGRQSTQLRPRPSMMKRPPQRTQLGRLMVVNGRESPEDEPPPFTPTTVPAYHPHFNSRPASPLHSPPAHATMTRFGTPPPRPSTAALPSTQPNSPAAYASPRAHTIQPPVRSIPLQDRPAPSHAARGPASFGLSHTSFNPNLAYASSNGSGSASAGAASFYGTHVASAMTPSKAANSASSQLYQSQPSSPPQHHHQAASVSTPPSPLLNREFSVDRSSVYSRISDSSVGSVNSHSTHSSVSLRGRAANASIGAGAGGPPPGAGFGLGPSARASVGGVSTYSTGSAPSLPLGQWATNEDQLMRDIYGSR
ncbi:unnamed protein product [Peniophora sp. CBMAI 1063]|nr:unnamed protein product [Peniophora sp. CBMAI 1063]